MRMIDRVKEICIKYPKSFKPTSAAEIAARLFLATNTIINVLAEQHKDVSIIAVATAYTVGHITAKHKRESGKYILDSEYESDINFYTELWDALCIHVSGNDTAPAIRLPIPDPTTLTDTPFDMIRIFVEYGTYLQIRGVNKTAHGVAKHMGFMGSKSFRNYGVRAEQQNKKEHLIRFTIMALVMEVDEKFPVPVQKYWYNTAVESWYRYLFVTKPLIRKALKNAMEKK